MIWEEKLMGNMRRLANNGIDDCIINKLKNVESVNGKRTDTFFARHGDRRMERGSLLFLCHAIFSCLEVLLFLLKRCSLPSSWFYPLIYSGRTLFQGYLWSFSFFPNLWWFLPPAHTSIFCLIVYTLCKIHCSQLTVCARHAVSSQPPPSTATSFA